MGYATSLACGAPSEVEDEEVEDEEVEDEEVADADIRPGA